jgi:hypothetical protein
MNSEKKKKEEFIIDGDLDFMKENMDHIKERKARE